MASVLNNELTAPVDFSALQRAENSSIFDAVNDEGNE